MKLVITLITVLLLTAAPARAQHINDKAIQDYFRQWAPKFMNRKGDFTGDVSKQQYLYLDHKNIKDLGGVEIFTSLLRLDVSHSNGIVIEKLPGSLDYFYCNACGLTALPDLPPLLTQLRFDSNAISTVNSLPSGLKELYCRFNTISALPALPSSLMILYCGYNNFSSLPELPANLKILDISYLPGLHKIPALPNGLNTLVLCGDTITEFPVLPSSLTEIVIDKNTYIKCIPNVPDYLVTTLYKGDRNDPYMRGFYSSSSEWTHNPQKCITEIKKDEIKKNKIITGPDPIGLLLSTWPLNLTHLDKDKNYTDKVHIIVRPYESLWARFWFDKTDYTGGFHFSFDPDTVTTYRGNFINDIKEPKRWGGVAKLSPVSTTRDTYLNFASHDYDPGSLFEMYIYPDAYRTIDRKADFSTKFKYLYSHSLSGFSLIHFIDTLNLFNEKEYSYRKDNKYIAVLRSHLSFSDAHDSYKQYQELIENVCDDPKYDIRKFKAPIEYYPNVREMTVIGGLKRIGGFTLDNVKLEIESDGDNTYRVMIIFETAF